MQRTGLGRSFNAGQRTVLVVGSARMADLSAGQTGAHLLGSSRQGREALVSVVDSGRVTAIAGVMFAATGLAAGTFGVSTRAPTARQTVMPRQLPIAAQALVSRTVARDDPRFELHRTAPHAWRLHNAPHKLSAELARDGVTVRAGSVSWRLGLRALGRGAGLDPIAPAVVRAGRNRATLTRSGITEWYANGPAGIEQGFTLRYRPGGNPSLPLTLALGLPRHADAHIRDSRDLVVERGRTPLLRYSGLSAVDARGRALHAWLRLGHGRLLVRFDDRRATYPVRVDPIVQAARLTASDEANYWRVGSSLSISGDGSVIAAGTPYPDGLNGAVYVFVRPAGGWASATETAKLTPSDPSGTLGIALGTSVAISSDGSTIAAGASNAAIAGHSQQGAVYVFVRPGGGWTSGTQTAKLTASDGTTQDELGKAVDISDNGGVVVGGAPYSDPGGNAQQGSVYVFKVGAGWVNKTESSKLIASDGVNNDQMGTAVAVSGDGLTVVGPAPYRNVNSHPSQGQLYVFEAQPLGGWLEKAHLTQSDGTVNDLLGESVATSQNGATIVAGAHYHPSNSGNGAVYVFTRILSWSTKTETAELTASDGQADELGTSVDISSDGAVVVAGAPYANSGRGALYDFARPSGGWVSGHEILQLTPAATTTGDYFGAAAAVSGDGLTTGGSTVAGTVDGHTAGGAVFVFAVPTSASLACPAAVTLGQSASCTATVASQWGTATPTGSVAFTSDSGGAFEGGGACTLQPTGTAGAASCHVAYKPASVASGSHALTATYAGDSVHQGSGAAAQLAVQPGPTSTSVSCSPAPIVGHGTTCTATVADSGATGLAPTGAVSFTSDPGGSFNGPSCTLAGSPASCSVQYTPAMVGAGTNAVAAAYGGDPNHAASQGTGTVGVARASTTTSVGCRPLKVAVAKATTCVATVTDTGSGSVTPSGPVHFTNSAKGKFASQGNCNLAPTATLGVAKCAIRYTPATARPATHTIKGAYRGDGNHMQSSDATLIGVLPIPKVKIRPTKLVAIRGVVITKLTCPAGETFCVGTEALAKGRTLLGRARFRIAGGKTKVVKLHLGATSASKLKRGKRTAVTVTAKARDRARRSATTRIAATLTRK
jgi:hypothetical protein